MEQWGSGTISNPHQRILALSQGLKSLAQRRGTCGVGLGDHKGHIVHAHQGGEIDSHKVVSRDHIRIGISQGGEYSAAEGNISASVESRK
jgi:hypothetical protein